MSNFDAARLSEWLRGITSTQESEIDCDELSQVIESAVEAAAGGTDVRATLPAIAVHLDHCPDCREWYEALVELTREGGG